MYINYKYTYVYTHICTYICMYMSSAQPLSPKREWPPVAAPFVTTSGNQPHDPGRHKAQRFLFASVSGEREGQQEGEGNRRQTVRKAEGGSDIHTEHSGVEPKLLHQVVCRTPHGRGLQKGRNVSARLTATSKPNSRSQAHGARMNANATTVKDQEVKQPAPLSTRSKELVQLAQSQMPCQSQTPALFGEARSQPAVYKPAETLHDAAGFRSGYVVTKVSEVYGNF